MSHNHPTYFDVAKKKLLQRANALSVNRWINAFRASHDLVSKGLSWEATGEATGKMGQVTKNLDHLSWEGKQASNLLVGFRCKQVAKIQTNIQRGLRRTPQISRDSCQLIPWCKVQRNGHRKRTLVPAACPDCSFLFFAGDGWCYQNIDDPKPLLNLTRQLFCKPSTCQIQVMTVGAYLREGGTKASVQFWWVKRQDASMHYSV